MIEYQYDLDLTPGRVPLEVPMKQFDTDFQLQFALIDRKGELTLETGTTAKIRGTKADGYGFSVAATLDTENKTVTVQGDEQMTIVAGKQPFELSILKAEKILNTATFYLHIYPAALSDDSIISESELTDFREAVHAASSAAIAANEAEKRAQESATYKNAAAESATAAGQSAAAAAQSAQEAADVFSLAGNVSFTILESGKVRMHFAET